MRIKKYYVFLYIQYVYDDDAARARPLAGPEAPLSGLL